jgi:hypothetical protein
MKKTMFLWTLMATMAVVTACSAQDPYSEFQSYIDSKGTGGTGAISGSNGTMSASSGELLTFSIDIDKTTAEPSSAVSEYFPDEEDILANNTFATEVAIDLSNPTAKTENGVTISNGSTTLASFTMPPYTYNNGTIMVSAPNMKSGTSYTLSLGSTTQSVTASNSISSSMGGGFPGGHW